MRLFLRKSRVGRGCSVSTRSENAVGKLVIKPASGGLSSIDYKSVPGDEIGCVGSEKDSCSFEVLGATEAA